MGIAGWFNMVYFIENPKVDDLWVAPLKWKPPEIDGRCGIYVNEITKEIICVYKLIRHV